ncbi:hypothetical protein [Flavobacterium lipolyticum]|uniref:Uncharacterized protein n=1 Tax=Flavobacterium lipolyticum TaxID=2893754 RepID=A0ABS8LVC6_9FLAO|nr:hypothetical protein [Flavobacterium sp. F-126]MCC9016527.1 hypothetical protein [Flavobacterium sp. F-126]
MKTNVTNETFLNKKDNEITYLIYALIFFPVALYFVGAVCGEALYYLLN